MSAGNLLGTGESTTRQEKRTAKIDNEGRLVYEGIGEQTFIEV